MIEIKWLNPFWLKIKVKAAIPSKTSLKGKTINVCYGRIGIQKPATQKKSFASTDLAKKYYEKKLREKINKGYK